MNALPKRVPRLWCALQGLLPLDACLVAQRAELAWPREPEFTGAKSGLPGSPRNHVAARGENMKPQRRASL
jgi:hypothetical protein